MDLEKELARREQERRKEDRAKQKIKMSILRDMCNGADIAFMVFVIIWMLILMTMLILGVLFKVISWLPLLFALIAKITERVLYYKLKYYEE